MNLLLEAKADIDAVHPGFGSTAFHYGCGCDRPDCAEALVRAGCDTTVRNNVGNTGRELAEETGCAAVLAWLSEVAAERMGERPAQTSAEHDNATKMEKAARSGEEEALSRLLVTAQ